MTTLTPAEVLDRALPELHPDWGRHWVERHSSDAPDFPRNCSVCVERRAERAQRWGVVAEGTNEYGIPYAYLAAAAHGYVPS